MKSTCLVSARLQLFLTGFFCLTLTSGIAQPLPAFPCAEGFGSTTPGGRGGQVIAVTNLNDDGLGSLRAAIEASGPRIVVFRVAGTIVVKSMLDITEPFITIAGQSAPGDGITIRNHDDNPRGVFRIRTHDVIMRHLRIRSGPVLNDQDENDDITLVGSGYNVIIDHCSLSWSTDELFQTGKFSNATVQYCILSEALHNSTHPKGAHSKGMHFQDIGGNYSIHHNLFAHNYDRNPNINTTGTFDFVNNVIYNSGTRFMQIQNEYGVLNLNVINNYFKWGPSTKSDRYEIVLTDQGTGIIPQMYVKGNLGFHRANDALPEDLIVHPDARFMIVGNLFPAFGVTTYPALQAFDSVLIHAGATYPVRDAHDQRIVQDARNGTGKIIDDPSEVGGWLVMSSGTPPVDTDSDGMPDAWEIQHGLNPNNPADRNGIAPSGYTWVEEYINELAGSNCSPIITSTQEFIANSSYFEVYPNPAYGSITLAWTTKQFSGNVELDIVNILGQYVYSETFVADSKSVRILDTQSFEKGIYIVFLKNNEVVSTQKLFIHH